MSGVAIPMDIYESPREIVILMPLGGVDKKSIELYFEDFSLLISGDRVKPQLKTDLVLQQDECYRGPFTQKVQLPPYVYFDRIHSSVSPDNILIITIPKSLQPGSTVKIDVELPVRKVARVAKKPTTQSKPTTTKKAPAKKSTIAKK